MRNGAGKRTAIHYEAGSTSCRDKRTHKYKSSDTERSCLGGQSDNFSHLYIRHFWDWTENLSVPINRA